MCVGLGLGAAVEGYRRLRQRRQEADEARVIGELFGEGGELDDVMGRIADELAAAIAGPGKRLGFDPGS